MQIDAMNHPARNPLEEIEWSGKNGFDFVDFTLEPPGSNSHPLLWKSAKSQALVESGRTVFSAAQGSGLMWPKESNKGKDIVLGW